MRRLLLGGLIASLSVPAVAGAVPAGERGRLEGAAVLTGVAVSDDGRIVAGADSSLGGLYVWDLAAPDETQTVTGCDSAADVIFVPRTGLDDRFYVACADGVLLSVDVDDDTIPAGLSSRTITLGDKLGDVEHLAWVTGDAYVHAIADSGTGYSVHSAPLSSGEVDDGLGLPLLGTGEVLGFTAAPDDGPLIIAHTDRTVRVVVRSAGTYSFGTPPNITAGTGTSIASHAEVGSTFVLDSSAGLLLTVQHSAPSTPPTTFVDELADPVAVSVFRDSSGAEPTVWIADRDGYIDVFGLDGVFDDFTAIDAGVVQQMVAGSTDSDPLLVRAADSTVRVLTDAPWVSGLSATPDSLGEGEEFVLGFQADEAGTWTLRDGGPTSSDGALLMTGELEADTPVEVTLSADSLSAEGENRLFVFVEGSAGTGVNSIVVTLDTPPSAIAGFTLEAGDEKLVASWTSGDEADIDHFEVYLAEEVFDSASLPEYTVTVEEEDVTYPVSVPSEGASTAHSFTVDGLTNDVRYYVALRAVDAAGATGPLTAVSSGVPISTCSAAECAGDLYGCTCSPNSLADARPGPIGVFALLLVLGAWARRRLDRA